MSYSDDDRPQRSVPYELGGDISTLSVDELKERVTLLKTEIERLEAEADRKASDRRAAENLFRL